MNQKIKSPYNGDGSITREQFLFFEVRTTAKLMLSGLPEEEIKEKIVSDNLFQYPTEKTLKSMARTCLKRLHALNNKDLVKAIATEPSDIARQICLYAMMKQYRLMWDFMITVIGTKFQTMDRSFGRIDLNSFFSQLQAEDEKVASWSDATIKKIKSVLVKILVENNYLDNTKADHLNAVLINPILEQAIRDAGEEIALPAFNCLS